MSSRETVNRETANGQRSRAQVYLDATRERLESALLYEVLAAMGHRETLRWVRRLFKLHSRTSQHVELIQRDLYHRLGLAHGVDFMTLEGALGDLEARLHEMSQMSEISETNHSKEI